LRPVVAVPARNEAERLPTLLSALAQQTWLFAANKLLDVVVVLNNCDDHSAEIVNVASTRHDGLRLHVVDVRFPPPWRISVGSRKRGRFWGAVLPTLPPLMAAENGPKKTVPNYGVPIAATDAAPLPAVAPPALTAPSVPPPALAIPAPHSSELKKIHTIIIRSEGSEQTATSAAAVTHNATSARAPGTR
jgi:hypothetical protein